MPASRKTFTIKSLSHEGISERNKYPKIIVTFDDDQLGEVRGYANEGRWNSGWDVGKSVEAMAEQKTSAKGTTYFQLNCPPELMKGGSGGVGGANAEVLLKAISHTLTQILNELVIARVKSNPEDAINDDDIPTDL